jgi:hypothetical protein
LDAVLDVVLVTRAAAAGLIWWRNVFPFLCVRKQHEM